MAVSTPSPRRPSRSTVATRRKPIEKLLGAWVKTLRDEKLVDASSFNLDFHSISYFGDDPFVEKHYVPRRSQRRKAVLTFFAQDAQGQVFCYSNADLRKGEESNEVLRFVSFWEKRYGERPRHLVFDSKLTTYANCQLNGSASRSSPSSPLTRHQRRGRNDAAVRVANSRTRRHTVSSRRPASSTSA
jgi:hypothetical protein